MKFSLSCIVNEMILVGGAEGIKVVCMGEEHNRNECGQGHYTFCST